MSKDSQQALALYVSIGLTIGTGLGVVFGELLFGNTGTGLALGSSIGMTIGIALHLLTTKRDSD